MTRRQISLYHNQVMRLEDQRQEAAIKAAAIGSSTDPRNLIRG